MTSSAPLPCRLCAAARTTFLYAVRGCNLDRCERCGFVQVRDQPTEEDIRSLYSSSYFEHGKYADDAAQRHENQRRFDLLAGTGLPRSARVLDAGCATGEFVEFVGERFDMWGIDVSDAAIDSAKRRFPQHAERFRSGFLEDQEFEQGYFDAVVMWDVIEHLWQPAETCRRLLRFVRPGGYLLLSTPDIGAITARIMRRRWAFMTPPEHLSFFSSTSMRSLLEDRLRMSVQSAFSRGKWANLGFLLYKVQRVFPMFPGIVVRSVGASPLGARSIYVPTGDIQYVVAQKAV